MTQHTQQTNAQYMVVSFSHKNVDLALREKLAFNDGERYGFLEKLCANDMIKEVVLLSTCNRVEIYSSVVDIKLAREFIFTTLEQCKNISTQELKQCADIRYNQYAVYHIFSVASSLDSLVVGETQIAGQLKDAYRFSYENLFCAKDMTRLIHHAFKCAASVRNATDISSSHTSVAGAAVAMIEFILAQKGQNLDSKKVAILGTGEMGILALKHLLKHNVFITLLNRNMQNARKTLDELKEQLSTEPNIIITPFSELKEILASADIFISATGASHTVVTKDMITDTTHYRIWFDLAVPRDIEDITIPNLDIYCVDDLQEIVNANLIKREKSAKQAYNIIEQYTQDFFKWLQSLGADPIIKHIRDLARQASQKELTRAIKKGYIPKECEKNVEKILHGAFNTFLHTPTMRIKQAGESINADPIIEALKATFDINDEIVLLNKYKCEEFIQKANAMSGGLSQVANAKQCPLTWTKNKAKDSQKATISKQSPHKDKTL